MAWSGIHGIIELYNVTNFTWGTRGIFPPPLWGERAEVLPDPSTDLR